MIESITVLGDALVWAEREGADVLLVETAGLCLRCSPYVDGGLGLVVLEATNGINLPLKVGPMLSLAEHFPEDPGPREIILPHNPMLTRELDIKRGEVLIGRPLGMSCGCPITHCGVAMDVDARTGVIVWCVTGPLQPRASGYKDLGYYIAEGYEGLVRQTRCEIKIGMRYFLQPRMCMLQWRHSGLVNYINRTAGIIQVRLEGLRIG